MKQTKDNSKLAASYEVFSDQENTVTIKEMCNIFDGAISTLTLDASNLRKVASISIALRSSSSITDENKTTFDDTNDNYSLQSASKTKHDDDESALIVQHLHDLENSVKYLEERMSMLQAVVDEEKRAINTLEETKKSAMEQNKIIQQIKSYGGVENSTLHLEDKHHIHTKGEEEIPISNHVKNNHEQKTTTDSSNIPPSEQQQQQQQQQPKSKASHSLADDDKDILEVEEICLTTVTREELMSVSKNTRGRIKLAVLNNAISDIEQVARNKYGILTRKTKQFGQIIGNTQRRSTKQYRDVLATHRELQVDEHLGNIWVSEQDMRDACDFFRLGESTARTILAILRSLKRLKQVSGKNSQVTYILSVSD